ncbi:MAG: tautomerase family protein [Pseudomonadota bacterium]
MPIIRVELFPGRTRAQKRALVHELTDAFVRTAGGKPEGVQVVITEVEPADWGSGGVLVADKLEAKGG